MADLMSDIQDTKLGKRELAIFWLGQNSFVIKTSKGSLVAVDPYFSRTAPEGLEIKDLFIHVEPPVRSEEFKVDHIFCTHDHLDHTDPVTLSIIARRFPSTMFYGPPESYKRFLAIGISPKKARGLKANEIVEMADFRVTPLSSIIGSELDEHKNPWVSHFGYVLDFEFVKVYNMGDSSGEVVWEPMKILKEVLKFKPDIAMLPIIGDFPARRPEDALKFARIIAPRIVVPCHYDCFKNRTIDPQKFAEISKSELGIKVVVIDYKGKYVYKA